MDGSKTRNRQIPDPRVHDSKLVYEHLGRWYLVIPFDKPVISTQPPYKDISCDPGRFETCLRTSWTMVWGNLLSPPLAKAKKILASFYFFYFFMATRNYKTCSKRVSVCNNTYNPTPYTLINSKFRDGFFYYYYL